MNPISAIIVDDEPHNIRDLRRTIAMIETEVRIVAEADTGATAIPLILHHEPDLLLLDIELTDMTGFDVMNRLSGHLAQMPAVIFVTGHDQFAVRAFRYAAVDYLMKPVVAEELQQAIMKTMASLGGSLRDQMLGIQQDIRQLRQEGQTFGVVSSEGIRFLDLSDILRIKAAQNRSHFYLRNGTQLPYVNHSIKQLQQWLENYGFLRVSQSDMVNVRHLDSVSQHLIRIQGLEDGVPISKRFRKEVMNQLRGLVMA